MIEAMINALIWTKPHGFIFSMLSHMISYLPFWKPILRVFFSFGIWGLEKKNRSEFFRIWFGRKASPGIR